MEKNIKGVTQQLIRLQETKVQILEQTKKAEAASWHFLITDARNGKF